jgi:hypothetical protein
MYLDRYFLARENFVADLNNFCMNSILEAMEKHFRLYSGQLEQACLYVRAGSGKT